MATRSLDESEIEFGHLPITFVKSNASPERSSYLPTTNENSVHNPNLGEFDSMNEAPNKATCKFIMTLIAFSMTFVGSKLSTLLFATLTSVVSKDLKAGTKTDWLFSAHLIADAATAPFVGSFSDVCGRKFVSICGAALSLLGTIVCATTPTADGYIAGQALGGMSMAIQELMAIVAISELVPIAKRGLYIGLVICGFIPFAPAALYSQWIAQHNWRYNACLLGVWNFLTIAMLAIYRPPPRNNTKTQSKKKALQRMGLVSSFLSITGIVLFLIGLNWGGKAIGLAFCLMFIVRELCGAKYPLFSRNMIQAPHAFICIMIVTFTVGISDVPLLTFWAVQATAVYGADHCHLGIYTLPFACCTLGGAIISALLLSAFRKHGRWILTGFCILQTIGVGCMAAADPHNIHTVWGPLIFSCLGAGGVLVSNQIIITAITPDGFMGTATALSLSIRAIGQVIGLTLLYNRFSYMTRKNAESIMLPIAVETGILDPKLIQSIVGGVTATPWSALAKTIHQIDTTAKYGLFADGLVTLYSRYFPILYYISVAFGAVACIASFFVGDLSLYMNEHVAVHF